jgi:hypothetical protein
MNIHEAPVVHVENSLEHFQEFDKAAFEAALAGAKEAGYRQGFQDGFLTNLKMQNGSNSAAASNQGAASAAEIAPAGKMLVGLPCAKCGRSYAASLSICPRCKAPAEIPANPTE